MSDRPKSKRWVGPLIISLIVAAGLGYVLWTSAEAQQVAVEAIFLIFTVFTTPFVLESSVAILGLIAVITYNQWRMSKDGPDWVEMEVPVSDAKDVEVK